ncbi:Uncharacterised protein [Moraxella lacunata]|uniref:Uncharacterized protein n=1 Tax=Moraxella lacunata TaxID=477 RepID=A0A378TWC8_MORLA|nr:hypothetical protein [Moraxella lacunata]STZ64300.1 Uncharacterised protein [Moraxella lacunata]
MLKGYKNDDFRPIIIQKCKIANYYKPVWAIWQVVFANQPKHLLVLIDFLPSLSFGGLLLQDGQARPQECSDWH